MQTIATFTGTLLRREHSLGQKFVQLVFREDGKDWLCVSSNLMDAKLPLGHHYRIEGIFKSLGNRQYLHDPQITPLKRRRSPSLVRRSSMAAASLLLVGGVALAIVLPGHKPSVNHTNTQPGTAQSTDGSAQTTGASYVPTATPVTTPTPTATAPAAASGATKPKTVKKATPVTAPIVAPATTDPGIGSPPADTTNPTPIDTGTNPVTDPTLPVVPDPGALSGPTDPAVTP